MKNYLLIALISVSSIVRAQTFEVDTIFKNGSLQERINLVFIGDGYQANELGKYSTDVNEILSEILSQSPFKEYKNYFNAFAINVISNQSGASHPRTSSDDDCLPVPALAVDNYFGSTFDYANIHRLLVPVRNSTLGNVLAAHLPQYDQVFVVVNSPYYGGSGGTFATGSDHESGKEIAIHEIGHSFARLADEYWAGPQYAAEKPNMTQQSNTSLVKWKEWLGVNGVSIYSHEEATSWKRPHQSCKMRFLGYPFCEVCTETFMERIHVLVKPLVSYSPGETTMPLPETDAIDFSLTLIKPDPNTLKITWEKNNVLFSKNQEAISIPASSFEGEGAVIRATVIDTTQLTRNSLHETSHVYVVEWTVGNVVTDITTVESEFVISVFPNPVGQEMNISYTLYKPAVINISLLDVTGRRIKTLVRKNQAAGDHHYQFDNYVILNEPGEYILNLSFDKTVISKKIIKQ